MMFKVGDFVKGACAPEKNFSTYTVMRVNSGDEVWYDLVSESGAPIRNVYGRQIMLVKRPSETEEWSFFD